ncbi:TetR/AcrR family transcriptional regulator [Mycolicibacterium mengxianglii]|uniref:TetR/AcrR family transcriptional regulator n=1 Tax=Mycolicibacterium mengxianglii TaxID=2736649 RepID=UPI0018D03079|nr:TetR/AcrR family transcriptional regulator [Mycolicibacterium mengxianglii]
MGEPTGKAAPGTVRPGGRTSRVGIAVLEATLQVLAERGYTGLTVERVAECSGVNKSTIYRRWQTRESLLAAAVDNMADELFPISKTGVIDEDLRSFGRSLVDALTSESPSVAGVMRALLSDAGGEPRIAEIKRDFFAKRYREAAAMVDIAIADGHLPSDTDVRNLVGLVAAPLYYRKLVTSEPLDHTVADAAVETALIALQAGACRT